MESKRKILIVYAKFGDGHYQVARTMERYLADTGEFEVKLVDAFAESHPMMESFFRFAFFKGSIYFPQGYGWLYSLTNRFQPNGRFNRWLHVLGAARMKELAEKEKPDAVIHTFPFLAMSHLIQKSGDPIACLTIVTDYVLHNRWIHPRTDRYFVATDDLKRILIGRGVSGSRICVSGIPVRPGFDRAVSDGQVRMKYRLPSDRPILLVMAGAYGVMPDALKIVESLRPADAEILFVCGRNARLHRESTESFAAFEHVHVFGFVEAMEELMSISSCLITKAGGITLAEARALRLPVVVYRPLPGQEKGNAEYWSEKGFVRIANTSAEIGTAVHEAMQWKRRFGHAGGKGRLLSADRPAAEFIVREIMKTLNAPLAKEKEGSSALPQERQVVNELR
ncbi:MGDG synthase family glycosyltransferase [Gorillibacterium massiliense]|uniref:MGDG synthase family glycosyltransferase n=1 Tax=Gorillibacterium massiliense TaxID=1280390 RepID=UPI0004B214CD|nr:glycosyltransferase [Gorillibacterium massiliense]